MNYEAAIAEVQQIVGWRSDKATQIGNALQYAQAQREKPGATFPWFLRSTKTIDTVAGTHSYSIPTGYIQDSDENDGNLFIYSDGTSKSRTIFLTKGSFKTLQERYFGAWPQSGEASLTDDSAEVENGTPREFALDGSNIFLYPVPDAAYTLYWKCWAAAQALSSGVENAWLQYAPWVLIGEAAQKIAADLGYAEGVAKAQAILSRANGDLFRESIHRNEAGRKRYMGSRL